MKKAIKLAASFLCGIAIGIIIVAAVFMFTGDSLSEVAERTNDIDITDIVASGGMSAAALLISILLQTIVHEGGHLVCGLAAGYRFVSFRIFNVALLRRNGRFTLRRFAVAGTGGQCLLLPPEQETGYAPIALYNVGGILANIMTVAIAAAAILLCDDLSYFAFTLMLFLIITGILFAAANGIPMKVGGIANDGYNILLFHRNTTDRTLFLNQLRINAMIQDGTRPRDIKEKWFEMPENIDFSDITQTSQQLMVASRMLDAGDTAAAHSILEEMAANSDNIPGLIRKEIECELIFTSLRLGDTEQARRLYSKELKSYINAFRNTMSSKQRILCAVALCMDNDREKALRIYRDVERKQDRYMMKGEVMMDLGLMETLLFSR